MIKSAYIHIPFCEHICHYCDFNKVFLKGQPVNEYLQSMAAEMKLYVESHPESTLETIFVGGGTPTSLNEQQLHQLCENITEILPFNKQIEFTFEANPGDLSKEKLQILKRAGVNRLSLGVQTFNDELLKSIGRVHRAEDVFRTVANAKDAGFDNISIDLIYSLPGQTIADVKETLETAFTLDISHYSAYSLIIEPKTVFYNLMRKGKLPVPGEDIEAAMYELVMAEMERHGYTQYEISNFAKSGFESRHNLTYWKNEEYFGFGAGAHSYVDGWRQSNVGPLKKYMDLLAKGELPLFEKNLVRRQEKMEEEMFLGLRKNEGVSVVKFIEKFDENPLMLYRKQLDELVSKGLLEVNENAMKLTKRGRLLGNEVFQYFLGVSND